MLFYLLFSLVLVAIVLHWNRRRHFWAIQPVFHYSDLLYWLYNVGIIQPDLPTKNGYVNDRQIVTRRVDELVASSSDVRLMKQLVQFIRLHYSPMYWPTQEAIFSHFVGHAEPSFLSYYGGTEYFMDSQTNIPISERQVIGCISSRPLQVTFRSDSSSLSSPLSLSSSSPCVARKYTMDVYYVDWLCVHKQKRKQQMAPELIQTHEYNCAHANRNISVSIFKREHELTALVPLTVFSTPCFSISKLIQKVQQRGQGQGHHHHVILTGDAQNMHYVSIGLDQMREDMKDKGGRNYHTMDVMICPSIGNWLALVASKQLLVYMKMMDREIVALYILKHTCISFPSLVPLSPSPSVAGQKTNKDNKSNQVVSLIASSRQASLSEDEFTDGFLYLVQHYLSPTYTYLTVEELGDNCVLSRAIQKQVHVHPLQTTRMAYYFYNFAHQPFLNSHCFIVN